MMDGVLAPAQATLAERIAAWSSALEYDALPREVVASATRCIVDVTGVALAAAPLPLLRHVVEHVRQVFAPGPASTIDAAEAFSPVGASLVNGVAAHALDFDDTSYTGIMHGSAVVWPAALAATQAAGGDGRRLIAAFVAGSEVAYAVALACGTRHYLTGWWSTATFGAFGAAAAAARGLDLNAAQTTVALALAGVQANGQKAIFGTDAKPFVAGRAAAMGVEAALLARRGLSGPTDVLEGRSGFVDLLNGGQIDGDAIDGLGKCWRLVQPGIFFKQYPVCSGAHAAVELTQRLLADNRLTGDDVRRIICDVTPVVAISLVHHRPVTTQQAQFSMPFAVGVMLARGELSIDSLTMTTLEDSRVRGAMAKVEMRRDDALHAEDAPEGARVTVITRSGSEFHGYLGQPTGMPGNPLSDTRLQQKFLHCVGAGGFEPHDARRLLEHLWSLEEAPVAFAPFRELRT